MSKSFVEKDFKMENFEEFYESHYFRPISDNDALNAHRVFPRVNWALDLAKDFKPTNILDLGCLEGYAALTIAKHVDSVEGGVGIDLSHDGIELAKKRAYENKLPLDFAEGSIEDFLEGTKEEFDFIMLFEVIEHVKDPEYLLQLIDTVKTEEGLVLISTPDFEAPTYGKDDEQNKCHIRLYTTADEDYEATNKYGTLRKATSMSKQVGPKRIKSMAVYSELIHTVYV